MGSVLLPVRSRPLYRKLMVRSKLWSLMTAQRDRTGKIVEAAAANDSRIRYFRTVKSGVAATRNFGISKARGKLIAPLDADDLWHPEKIARQVEAMQASSPADIGLVYCWAIEIDENDLIIPSS